MTTPLSVSREKSATLLIAANTSVVGSEPIDALAEKIWHSVGPSGPNKDYLYGLSAAVRQLSPESHDSHLYALEVVVLLSFV